MQLSLTVRDLEPDDLTDISWSGGSEHVTAVAQMLMATYAQEAIQLVVALPNGRLVATGAVDLRTYPDAGSIEMLSVHETLQGLGIGTLLIRALEDRIRASGLRLARLGVEHDNARAAGLYRRLGYREVGSALESWPVAGGRRYVTVTTVLERDLGSGDG